MTVDTAQMNKYRAMQFERCLIRGLTEYLKQPGAREALDARTEARRLRNAEAAVREENEAAAGQ